MRLGEGDYKLPDFIPTRGFLLLEEKKISKSRRWGITIRDYLGVLPPDYLRFYLTRITPYAQTDSNFDLQEFKSKINNELVANIGNFAYRSLVFVDREYGRDRPRARVSLAMRRRRSPQARSKAVKETSKLIEAGNYDRALKAILEFSTSCNQYFQSKAPWEKRDDAETAIYTLGQRGGDPRSAPRAVPPVHLRRALATARDREAALSLQWEEGEKDLLKPGHKIAEPKPLFRKVERLDLESLQEVSREEVGALSRRTRALPSPMGESSPCCRR